MVIPTVTAAVVMPCDAPASHIFGKGASDLLVPLVQHTASGQRASKGGGMLPDLGLMWVMWKDVIE